MTWMPVSVAPHTLRSVRFLGNGRRATLSLLLDHDRVVEFFCSEAQVELTGSVRTRIDPWDDDSLVINYSAEQLDLIELTGCFSDDFANPMNMQLAAGWNEWVTQLPEMIAASEPKTMIPFKGCVVIIHARLHGASADI